MERDGEQRVEAPAADFDAYALGPSYASVCTTLADAEATARLNTTHPTRRSRWQIADEAFFGGQPNGAPCGKRPATHRHLLFEH